MTAGDAKHPSATVDEAADKREDREGEATEVASPSTVPVNEGTEASAQEPVRDDATGSPTDGIEASGDTAPAEGEAPLGDETDTGDAPVSAPETDAPASPPPGEADGARPDTAATVNTSDEISSDTPEGADGPADTTSDSAPEEEPASPPAPRTLAEALAATSTEDEDTPEDETPGMTLLDHLGELRVRLVRCLIAVGLAFAGCYSFAEKLFDLLMQPLVKAMPPDSKLIFTALPEAFFVYMQVGLVAATFVASPFIFYQIWAFISPGLYEEEKKNAIPIALFSASFFIGGAAFCYFQVFPYAFEFFMGFATDRILPMPSLSEYLGFALKMLLAFGIIFEMPLFTFFLAKLGILTAGMMRRGRKYAILGIFIVAAILTPPDVFSQMLMACPMLVLYEISIFIAAAVGRKEKTDEEEDGDADEATPDERPEQGH